MNTYLESNKERFLNELFELIKIPSISAVKEYDNETRKAAIFLKDQFESLGFSECEICETKGHHLTLLSRKQKFTLRELFSLEVPAMIKDRCLCILKLLRF